MNSINKVKQMSEIYFKGDYGWKKKKKKKRISNINVASVWLEVQAEYARTEI